MQKERKKKKTRSFLLFSFAESAKGRNRLKFQSIYGEGEPDEKGAEIPSGWYSNGLVGHCAHPIHNQGPASVGPDAPKPCALPPISILGTVQLLGSNLPYLIAPMRKGASQRFFTHFILFRFIRGFLLLLLFIPIFLGEGGGGALNLVIKRSGY